MSLLFRNRVLLVVLFERRGDGGTSTQPGQTAFTRMWCFMLSRAELTVISSIESMGQKRDLEGYEAWLCSADCQC